jgi:histidinol dehydrogenase
MLELIDGRDQDGPVAIPRPRMVGTIEPEVEARRTVDDVRLRGDAAVLEHGERRTGARLTVERLRVGADEIAGASKLVRPEFLRALEVMREQLRATCERQLPETWMEQRGDQMVGELIRPLRRVAVHVPRPRIEGGAAPASTVLMGAVPAEVAGVGDVVVCTSPAGRGDVAEGVLAACSVAGVDEVYRMEGPAAVAALAYGTATVRPVEAIVGPGDEYVEAAKRMVHGWVGTDAAAWPAELTIVADDTADPRVVASDLVAHAERGPLGAHVLITWTPELLDEVIMALELVVAGHERAEEVENTLVEGGSGVVVRDLSHALQTANAFAPQHLQLVFAGALDALDRVRNAGAVSVGPTTGPAAGYVGGINGIAPSGGVARWASALGVRNFVKSIPVCGLEPGALERLGPHARSLAEGEGLTASARAVDARLAAIGEGRS